MEPFCVCQKNTAISRLLPLEFWLDKAASFCRQIRKATIEYLNYGGTEIRVFRVCFEAPFSHPLSLIHPPSFPCPVLSYPFSPLHLPLFSLFLTPGNSEVGTIQWDGLHINSTQFRGVIFGVLITYPDPPTLPFLEKKQGKPEKGKGLSPAEPLKSLEKAAKTHKKDRKSDKKRKQKIPEFVLANLCLLSCLCNIWKWELPTFYLPTGNGSGNCWGNSLPILARK